MQDLEDEKKLEEREKLANKNNKIYSEEELVFKSRKS